MTVEEVARLATRFGWSYEALMSMTLPERRLWLAAADAVPGSATAHGAAPAPAAAPLAPATAAPGVPGPAARGATVAPPAAEARLTTEEERRARLYQLLKEYRKERERT